MKKSLLIIILMLFACELCNAETKLKRYKRITESTQDNSLVSVSVLSYAVTAESSPPTRKTVFELSDHGQEAVLSGKSNEQVSELLNKKFQTEEAKKSRTVDLGTRDIRITFSIDRKVNTNSNGLTLYDRIEDLELAFEMDKAIDAKIKFTKWNKYVTEYGTLDVGTLEYNQSFSANLDATGKVGASTTMKSTKVDGATTSENTATVGPEASVTPKVGYSASKKENQSIKQRYVQLTGKFDNRHFSLHEQGTRETELAGNLSVDISINLPTNTVRITALSGLYDANDDKNPPAKVKFEVIKYELPNPVPLTGILTLKYTVRHIEKGARTFPEFDDVIHFINGSSAKPETIISAEDLKVPLYFIKVDLPVGNSNSLQYSDVGGTARVFQFLSYDEAVEFRNWLIETIPSIGKSPLTIKGKVISFGGIAVNDPRIKADSRQISVDVLK